MPWVHNPCENSISLLGQVGASLEACSLDMSLSAPSKLSPTASMCSSNANAMPSSHPFLSGMMSAPLTDSPGADVLMSSAGGSLVKTLALPEEGQGSTEHGQDSGKPWRDSFARYDHDTSLWKTPQCSLLVGLDVYLETWPPSGFMHDGQCWERMTLGRHTSEIVYGYMPTLMKTMILETSNPVDNNQISISTHGYIQKIAKTGKPGSATWPLWMLVNHALPTPRAAEFFMGWPEGWTDLAPLEMDKYHSWLQQHGDFYVKEL